MELEQITKEVRIGYRKKRNIVSVVREHYIRDDIPCKVEGCQFCKDLDHTDGQYTHLSPHASHYVIPDAQLLADYLEIFEQPSITGVILSHTALTRIRSKVGCRSYERAVQLLYSPINKSIVFSNEHHVETFATRNPHESEQEWQQRLTFRLGVWYVNHLGLSGITTPVVVVSNQIQFEAVDGLLLMNMADYLLSFWPDLKDVFALYESLTSVLEMPRECGLRQNFSDYFPDPIVNDGLRKGTLYAGMLRVNRHNPKDEAFVSPRVMMHSMEQDLESSLQGDVLIHGVRARNRAIHGDIVAVQLLPCGEWKVHPEYSRTQRSDSIPTGMVVGVIQRADREYVATFDDSVHSSHGKMEKVLVYPYDIRVPKIRIATRQIEELKHHRIAVRIDSWEVGSQYPNGHFVRSIGPIGDLETEISVILTEHELVATPFTKALLNELPSDSVEQPWTVEDSEVGKRRDLRRSHLIFSIDPQGCEDVDDTLSVRHLKQGDVELGVHIADVSHFVKPGSLTDTEAKARSTTVYLADRRYDMLPAVLSADLCSLLSEVDRYAVSVIWHLDSNYHVKSVWFGRTLIRSRYKLSYEIAQSLFDGSSCEDAIKDIPELLCKSGLIQEEARKKFEELRRSIVDLVNIARVVRHRRALQGGLELEGIEVRVQLNDKDRTEIDDLIPKKPLEMHDTIAECMIFANKWVAKKLGECYPAQALLRHHPPPMQDRFEALCDCARARGFSIDTSDNKTLAQSLDSCVDPNDPNVNKILRYLATQAMTQARYFSSGSLPQSQHFHYGLALEFYTHFTSPIRRYADLVVHRQLLAAVGDPSAEPDLLPGNVELDKMAQHMNTKHRSSQLAQIASVQLFQCLYFASHHTKMEDHNLVAQRARNVATGVVMRTTENGIMVFVARYGITSRIRLKDKNGLVLHPDGTSTIAHIFEKGSIEKSESGVTVFHSGGEYTLRLFDHVSVHVAVEKSHTHGLSLVLKLASCKPISIGGTDEEGTQRNDKLGRKELIEVVRDEAEAVENKTLETLVNNSEYKQSHKTPSLYSLFKDMQRLAITES